MLRKISSFSLLMIFILPFTARGLVPLESFLLGDQTDKLIAEKESVINDLFSFRDDNKIIKNSSIADSELTKLNKKKVAYLRGLYEGGKKLQNFCKVSSRVTYTSSWEREQVTRTMIAGLQFISLDYIVKALAQYAQYFQYSKDDFSNLSDRLVGGYCSKNLTVISLKQLKKNLSAHFERKFQDVLPTIKNNKLFYEKKLSALHPHEDGIQREFLKTVELFKSVCSWGNDTEKLRLIYPLMRNPMIMSFVIRQMSGIQLAWRDNENRFVEVANKNGVHISCQNLVCRKTDKDTFVERLPKALGQNAGVRSDFERLYCEDMQRLKKNLAVETSKKGKEWLKNFSIDDEKLLEGQFLALISQTPDFFVRAKTMKEGLEISRTGLDYLWDTWAQEQLNIYNEDIYYEEPLSIEVVDRNLYFNKHLPKFKVVFDINLGEFDRLNQYIGKIKTNFVIKLPYNFLNLIRDKWIDLDPRRPQDKKSLIDLLVKHVEDNVDKTFKKFVFPPLRDEISTLIAKEIFEQLGRYKGQYFTELKSEFVDIPVQLQFGTFALKYVRYVYRAKRNKRRWTLRSQ